MRAPIDETHHPDLATWVVSARGHSEFPIQNLPFGVFSPPRQDPRGGVAIGDLILDLRGLAASGLLSGEAQDAAEAGSTAYLNALLACGPSARLALRRRLSALLSDEGHRSAVEPLLHPSEGCTLHLPARIGDYTDFYVGIHHATNVGKLFRPDNPLLPNYKHVPIGYHGRASSVQVSGTPVRRPSGQLKLADADASEYAATRRLDYELEMGVWIGPGNALGEPVPIGQAEAHVGGLCLLNDWSARDIQAWEYQPLGPFLAKNFLTTISPWIVTAEALAPFREAVAPRPPGDPAPLGYLLDEADQLGGGYAITLEAYISTAAMRAQNLAPHRLSTGPLANMYWSVAQMVAHHTSSGCNLNPGDLLGTGTISAPTDDGFGSLLEISRGGREPFALKTGETRCFLEDGDEVVFSAHAIADGYVSIGFGPCRGVVAHRALPLAASAR